MSETSQGEGWWQASDLKWYPPALPPPPSATAGMVPDERTQSTEQRQAAWLIVVGAVVAGLAAFLPWAVIRAPFVGQLNKTGIEGDGVFALLLAGGVGICGIRNLSQQAQAKSHLVIATVLTGLLLLLAGYEFVDISRVVEDADSELPISISLGSGVYVLGFGALLAGVGCWLALKARRRR